MPPLPIVRASNATFSPSYVPTAVFVGGTSGIGKGIAQAFARHTKGNANIILVGRNAAAAAEIIASFPPPPPTATHAFVPCDVSLMRNVHTLGARLPGPPTLNFLVITSGFMSPGGREETAEGLDRRLALHYYARWKLVCDLAPRLERARDAGQDAKVMSVYSAGSWPTTVRVPDRIVRSGDWEMKQSYSASEAGSVGPTYNDLMMESFAERHPGIAFVHANPGGVNTNLLSNSPSRTVRCLYPVVGALVWPWMVSEEVCGEHLFWGLRDAKAGAGRRSSKGDDMGKSPYTTKEVADGLWQHTVAKMQSILGNE